MSGNTLTAVIVVVAVAYWAFKAWLDYKERNR